MGRTAAPDVEADCNTDSRAGPLGIADGAFDLPPIRTDGGPSSAGAGHRGRAVEVPSWSRLVVPQLSSCPIRCPSVPSISTGFRLIPDIAYAVDSPRRLSDERSRALEVLELAASFPTLTWGRDELGTGDMWNSNSLVAWLLTNSGHDVDAVRPPPGGRAPGWDAGVIAARAARPPARTRV